MKALFLTIFILSTFSMMAQNRQSPFYENYERYKYEKLKHRRFKHEDILPLIRSLKEHPDFTVTKEGESVQGRAIFMLKVGEGEIRVLLWSQMHGDEPTATMALMDILNFFSQPGDELESVRQMLLKKLSIYFIPMLNPDGAEVFRRRNALEIDLNRDALQLQSPESQILKSVRDRVNADWGFNLHDQHIRYAAGKGPKPASISFLAPPFDEGRSVNEVRQRAMQLIVGLNNVLQAYIPGQVGKWSDEFEPKAFGDNIQRWGTSTVLIESGGYQDDPEKQYLRKLNFVAIMEGLQQIASGSYANNPLEPYFEIPENEPVLYNLLIRNAQVEQNGKWYHMDIGINRAEVEIGDQEGHDFYYKSSIEELGDMSVFYGYEELDAMGLKAEPGEIYPKVFANMQALENEDLHQLIRSGYTSVRMRELPAEGFIRLPLNVLPEGAAKPYTIALDATPNFVLKKDAAVHFAIVNGFVYDVRTKENGVKNALVEERID
jgi:hypothetical protein